MKKLLQLIFILAALTLMLASCKFGGNKGDDNLGGDNSGDNSGDSGDTGDSGNTDTPPADNENTIWSANISGIIVDADDGEGAEELRAHIGSLTGKYPTILGTDAASDAHEILLGETGRDLSEKAYKRLDRKFDIFELESQGYSAYFIYAEGGSLAVAYTDVFAKVAAIEYVQKNIKDKSYSANGSVAAEQFKTTTFVAEKREALREIGYASIEKKLGADAAEAVKQLYSLYDEGIYVWYANLYDPSSGGFYYSGSARDTVGFLPDLESTAQGLGMLVTSGVADDWSTLLTDEMKTKLLLFVYDMQSPDDYYYYHPQWGTSIGSSRRGRDAGWAKEILEVLGQPPKYQKSSSAAASASYLTSRLGDSSVFAASRVVATAATASELQSEAAFRDYLDDANISQNSYSVFNNLSARTSEIRAAGLWDFLLDYLIDTQCANGLWEPTVSYQSVNGLMKISTFFNSSKPFPNPDKAIESIMQVLSYTDNTAITQIVYVYNPWVALKNILPYCSETSYAKYMSILTENADSFLIAAYQKLSLFKREDGGFSYMQDRTAHESQQVLVAVEGTKESDVNSTSIAISTVLRYILRVYDLEPPKLYYKYDNVYFTETLHSMGEIIKDSAIADPEVVTFDDYDSGIGDEHSGVVHQPHEIITNNVGDDGMVGTDYLWFTSNIVPNPAEGAKESDLVLYVADKVYPDAEKQVANAQSSTEIRITNYTAVGNCYTFESDIWFDGASDNKNPAMQLMYCTMGGNGQSAWLNFYPYEKNGVTYLRICDEWEGADGKENTALAGEIPLREWFRLRIELYKDTNTKNGKLDMKMKIYVNDVFVGESDSCRFINGQYQNFTVNAIRLAYYRHSASAFYFNNMYAAKSQKTYTDESSKLPGVSAPISYDFEAESITDGVFGYTYSAQKDEEEREVYYQTTVDSTEMASGVYGAWFSLANDPASETNKVLKIKSNDARTATAGSIAVAPVKQKDGSVHIVEYDYYLESNTAAAATLLNVSFVDALGLKIGGNPTAAYNLASTSSYTRGIFQLGTTSTTADGVHTLDAGRWYKIRIAWDQENGIIRYSYSIDNGENWYSAAKDGERTSTSTVAWVEIIANTYNNVGVQYIDNLSYTVTNELPGVKAGKPDTGYVNIVKPGGQTVYDFETDALLSGEHINVDGNVFSKAPNADDYVESEHRINYSGITTDTSNNGKFGVAMSITADTANAANKVLQMQYTHSGSLKDSVLTVASSTDNRNYKVNVLEFDYYLVHQSKTGSSIPLKIRFNDEEDKPIGSAFNFIQALAAPVSVGQNESDPKKAFLGNGVGLYSRTWYKFRVIWDQNEGTCDFYYSTDNGETFIKLGETAERTAITYAPSVSLVFSAWNWQGVQQLDNISYKIVKTVPAMNIKVPTAEELGNTVPGGQTVYDFETDALLSGNHIKFEGHVYESSPSSSNTDYNHETDHKKYDSISSSTNYDGKIGTSLSIATDKTNAANKVLKIQSKATGGAASTNITIAASSMADGGKVSVIEFDYMLLWQTNTGKSTPFKFQFNNKNGDSIGSSHNFIQGNQAKIEEGAAATEAFNYNGEILESSTWYRIRIVWDRNEGKLYYYYSYDSGATYLLAGEAVSKSAGTGDAESVTFMLSPYNWEGVQYIDNLSYKVVEDVPTYVEGTKPEPEPEPEPEPDPEPEPEPDPEPDESESDGVGEGNIDDGGWEKG